MDRVKFLLLTLCLTLIVTSVALYLRNGKIERGTTIISESLPENADMQLTGINFTEVDQVGREWNMEAMTLHYYKAQDLIVLDRVKATFYSADGPTRVAGDKGYYDKAKRKVKLVGHVQAEDSQGRHLISEEVRYDLDEATLHVPGSFQLTGPRMDLKGEGLWVNTKTTQYKVLGQADLIIKGLNSIL